MSGFNKPSRLAPQGSGKNHESSKDSSPSSSEQSTSNAKPGGGAAKPGGKKLQWSMGDLLNKLENPETPLAAAKASVDVNSTPGSTPQTRTAPPLSSPAPDAAKKVAKEPAQPEKPVQPTESSTEPTAKSKEESPSESALSSASSRISETESQPVKKTVPEPEWATPPTSVAPEWDLPDATPSTEANWATATGKPTEEAWSAPDAPYSKPAVEPVENWGKTESEEPGALWGASNDAQTSPDLWAQADNKVDLWANQMPNKRHRGGTMLQHLQAPKNCGEQPARPQFHRPHLMPRNGMPLQKR